MTLGYLTGHPAVTIPLPQPESSSMQVKILSDWKKRAMLDRHPGEERRGPGSDRWVGVQRSS